MSEAQISPQSPPGLRPVTRTQEWAQRVASPWAWRSRRGRLGALTGSQIGRLTARLQRRAAHRPTWLRRAGALSPRMVDGFVGALAQRFTLPPLQRAAAGESPSSLAPIDMPLAGGESLSDAPAAAATAFWPTTEAPAPSTLSSLPPLGTRRAGRAEPPTQSPAPAPRPLRDVPRPTAGRIRRYSRVEEVDPLALAAQNERRQAQSSPMPASPPASPTDAAGPPAADPAAIQRSAATPTPPGTAAGPPAGPGTAGEPPATGAEQSGLSVLQRLRQARAAQLQRQAQQAAASADSARRSASPSPSVEAPSQPAPSSPTKTPQGRSSPTTPAMAPSPTSPAPAPLAPSQPSVPPTLRRSVGAAQAAALSDQALAVEKEAGDIPPTQASPTAAADADAPARAAPEAATRQTPPAAVQRAQGSGDIPPAQASPTAAADADAPARAAQAAPASEPSADNAPAEDQPLGPTEPPASPLLSAGRPARRTIRRAAEAAGTGEDRPAAPASSASSVDEAQHEPAAQELAAAFAERVVARAVSQARLPVNADPQRTAGRASHVVRRVVRPRQAALAELPLAQRRGETDRLEAQAARPETASPPDALPAAATGEAMQNAAPEAMRQTAGSPARPPASASRSAQASRALAGAGAKTPVWSLPLLRRQPLFAAVHRSPMVLPQARASRAWDGRNGADGDGQVGLVTEHGRAPARERPEMFDRRPGATASPAERFPGSPARGTVMRRLAETMPVSGAAAQRASQPAGQPVLPLVRRTAPPQVQRASGSQPPPASPEPAQPEPTRAAPASPPDLQALARKVYPILKRMLAVERERLRGA